MQIYTSNILSLYVCHLILSELKDKNHKYVNIPESVLNVHVKSITVTNLPAKARATWSSKRAIFLTVLSSCSFATAFFSTPNTTTFFPLTPTYKYRNKRIPFKIHTKMSLVTGERYNEITTKMVPGQVLKPTNN